MDWRTRCQERRENIRLLQKMNSSLVRGDVEVHPPLKREKIKKKRKTFTEK